MKKILVVEDEKSLRDLMMENLKARGYLAIGAENGTKGLELALSEHPELILLDLIMPGMDGMAVLKKIRSDAWGENVPVIILTNISEAGDALVEDILIHKPVNYLIKSDWNLRDIVDKVEKLLETQDTI